MNIQEVVSLALQLQPIERFELVDQILHSLDQPDENINKMWLAEAEKRTPFKVPTKYCILSKISILHMEDM